MSDDLTRMSDDEDTRQDPTPVIGPTTGRFATPKRPFQGKKGIIRALLICVIAFSWYYDDSSEEPLCFRPDEVDADTPSECFFSSNYFEARQLFLHFATKAGAELKSFEIVNGGLTTDVAIFKGSSDKLLLHISGVHGVEGFLGSAIQSAAMARGYVKNREDGGPTVVLVHAVNPWGMAYLRRWNENNVDLNRNALFSEEAWEEVLNRRRNEYGYEDIDSIINPKQAPGWDTRLKSFALAGLQIARHMSLTPIKKAMVAATYTNSKGIFYGGTSLEKSHEVLRDFLKRFKPSKLRMIDVHTGLGPSGIDTLILPDTKSSDKIKNLFWHSFGANERKPHKVEFTEDAGLDAASGYEATKGIVSQNYPLLFPGAKNDVVSIIQEFGTVHQIWVALGIIEENQAYQFGPKGSRAPYAKSKKDAFIVPTQKWMDSTLRRGIILFRQLHDDLESRAKK